MIAPSSPHTNKSVAQHYDDLDSYYRRLWGEHLHHGLWENDGQDIDSAIRRLIEKVADAAAIQSGSRVFDVGSGYGATARYLADKYGAQLTAITLSPVQYEFAKSVPTPSTSSLEYLLGDWLEYQVPSEVFDAVIAIESSEHMEKAAFFQQAFKALRPGGRIVVCAWLAKSHLRHWEEKYLIEPICREGRLESMGTADDYLQWLEDAGFADIRYEDLSEKVKQTWSFCAKGVVRDAITKKKTRQFLMNHAEENRVFAKTVFRIWLAYLTRSMRFGMFSGVKPAKTGASNEMPV